MSSYLVERIKAQPNIELLTGSEIFALEGEDGMLDALRWRNRKTGEETRKEIRHLFLFIGGPAEHRLVVRLRDSPRREGLHSNRCGARAHARNQSGRRIRHRRCARRLRQARGLVRREGAQVVATLHAYLAQARERYKETA